MSFRFELKSFGSYSTCKNFIEQLSLDGLKQLHPPRYVVSEYFDTVNFDCVIESQEGTVPRKKLRIRYYSENNNSVSANLESQLNLETKISSTEGRFKTIKNIDYSEYKSLKKHGIFVNSYGKMTPSLKVSYLRHYYQIDGVRLTFDSNISKSKLRENTGSFKINSYVSKLCVIELKSNESDCNLINNSLAGLRLQRFSKYADSFYKL
jgi:hypothetical protein